VLEEEGYLVCSVRHESAAWHELDHKRFDVVVMGFSSQGAELAVLKPCRSQIASVPVFFMSVGSSSVQAWRPIATLRRPCDIDRLLRILRAILHEPAVHPFWLGNRPAG
jgi:DNA-binding NtrC family response regulator